MKSLYILVFLQILSVRSIAEEHSFLNPNTVILSEKGGLANGIESSIRVYRSFSPRSYSPFIYQDKSIRTQLLIIKIASVAMVIILILYLLFRKRLKN